MNEAETEAIRQLQKEVVVLKIMVSLMLSAQAYYAEAVSKTGEKKEKFSRDFETYTLELIDSAGLEGASVRQSQEIKDQLKGLIYGIVAGKFQVGLFDT